MKSFKDFVRDDVGTFVNLNEFADMHTVDGREVRVLIDDYTEDEHPLSYAEGVSVVQKKAFFIAADFTFRPREGIFMMIDGKSYLVRRVSDEMGLYVVLLEANVD
ncbi:hypothetical protein [Paenibacillus sp. 2TAB19]|uniref:hypothetical protein n=1 Tax=Paenibacillus sp. 2TAB19 TaxID=3233003 RepID=UPI003F9B18E8